MFCAHVMNLLLLRVRIDQEVHVFILLDANIVNLNEYTVGSHRPFRLLENVMRESRIFVI